MKKIIIFLAIIMILMFQNNLTFAQEQETNAGGTILPDGGSGASSIESCNEMLKMDDAMLQERIKENSGVSSYLLGCAVKTGRVKLWMIPYYIRYLAQFLIALGGIICMFFIVLGGYYYSFGGLSQDKDKGKNTILYACLGLIVISLAWILVNIVIYAVTQ